MSDLNKPKIHFVAVDIPAAARRWLFFRIINKFTKLFFYIIYRAIWKFFFLTDTLSITAKKTKKRILIIRPDHIGDFILSLPSLLALKSAASNDYTFEILINPCNASIAKRLGIFDCIYIFQMFGARREKLLPSCYEYHQIAKTIADVDVLIDMRADLTTQLLVDWIKTDLNSPCVFIRAEKRLREYESIHEFVQKVAHDLKLNPENRWHINMQIAQRLLIEKFPASLISPRPIIALCSEARLLKKVWSRQQIDELIKQLSQRFGDCYTLLILGEKSPLHQYQYPCVLDMRGKTALDQAFELVNTCQLFIGFDSGLTHIASLMGKPTIAIFNGYTNASKWAPMSVQDTLKILQPVQSNQPDIAQVLGALSQLMQHSPIKGDSRDP